MKKLFCAFLSIAILTSSVTFFSTTADTQSQTDIQQINCVPFPKTEPTSLGADIPKFMSEYSRLGPACDERQYLIQKSSAAVADWGGTGITRFLDSPGYGDVVYRFDLENTTTKFEIVLVNQGYLYTVSASKDNSNWLPIGVDSGATLPDRRTSVYPEAENTQMVANMQSVLQDNPEKVVYIKLSLNGGALYYQFLRINAFYTNLKTTELATASYKLGVKPTNEGELPFFYTEQTNKDFVSEEGFLGANWAGGPANWGNTGIFRFLDPNQYAIYKFNLDNKAVDFNVKVFAQANNFNIEVSKDGTNWTTLRAVQDVFDSQKDYVASNSDISRAVLENNIEKIVYVRVFAVSGLTAYNQISMNYSYYISDRYYNSITIDRSKYFDVNVNGELAFIKSNTGTVPFYWGDIGQNVRQASSDQSIIYKFDLGPNVYKANLYGTLKYDYNLQISNDGEAWAPLISGSSEQQEDINVPITPPEDGVVFIKFDFADNTANNFVSAMLLNMGINYSSVLKYGDLNSDDNLNILDVLIMKDSLLGSKQLSEYLLAASDINKDKINNVNDLIALKNSLLGI